MLVQRLNWHHGSSYRHPPNSQLTTHLHSSQRETRLPNSQRTRAQQPEDIPSAQQPSEAHPDQQPAGLPFVDWPLAQTNIRLVVEGYMQADPVDETIKVSRVRNEVGKRMGLTAEHMAAVKGQMRTFIHEGVRVWNRSVASGPAAYQQIAPVPWHTLSKETQTAIMQICTAVDTGKVAAAFLAQYLELACKAVDYQMPPAPSIGTLGGFGGLVETCLAMKVTPPSHNSRDEYDKARNRLRGLSGQGPFDLSRHICSKALADLHWARGRW